MKKIFVVFAMAWFISVGAWGAVSWWQQPTVCRIDNTKCYPSMGVGFDAEYWDTGANCRGMKYICADAISGGSDDGSVLMGRNEIAAKTNIKSDFDTDLLNGDCFGARRMSSDGTQAFVNGKYVNVWCPGVLSGNDIIVVDNGEVTSGPQPTCAELRRNGFVAMRNGKCFGREYSDMEYFIECNNGNDSMPSLIVLLNGADVSAPGNVPVDKDAANTRFNEMESMAEQQRRVYFK